MSCIHGERQWSLRTEYDIVASFDVKKHGSIRDGPPHLTAACCWKSCKRVLTGETFFAH